MRSIGAGGKSPHSHTGDGYSKRPALCDVLDWHTMNLLTLTEIRRAAQNGAASARVHVQVESATPKLTREQQPYCELTLADACDRMTLRVWSDHPEYKTCSALTTRGFHRAHRGVLPVAIRTRRPQVDGAATDRTGKK